MDAESLRTSFMMFLAAVITIVGYLLGLSYAMDRGHVDPESGLILVGVTLALLLPLLAGTLSKVDLQ